MDEFQLIDRYFRYRQDPTNIRVGIGDDGAVIRTRAGEEQVIVTDSLVAGVHFLDKVSSHDLGHKALAVNLSDLAAMGAEPDWATLNLTLPSVSPEWIGGFAAGFFELADRYGVTLAGGDTSHGPLNVTVTAGGWVPAGQALCRTGARIGHFIYVSGTLGNAALAQDLLGELDFPLGLDQLQLADDLHRPEPRITLGIALRNIASSVIDLSDGLVSDLGQVVSASGNLGALIDIQQLPLSNSALVLRSREQLTRLALVGGDDYELCFSAKPERYEEITTIGRRLNLQLTKIGYVDGTPGIRVVSESGVCEEYTERGYCHVW